ncbi:hypothetical protein CEXT_393841 [Caerostris extrusa]|uniref:Uncharacterized protein n=1 Tax=Caerostris extrusa TaxID=172846 RepID=A0AAV4RFV4_CAEEX|nr:hypothetical protein CEXT_393841 [Caerostris extrusa]
MAGKDSLAIEDGTEVLERDFSSVPNPEFPPEPEEQRRLPLSTGRKCYVNVAKGASGENGSVSKMAGKDSLAIENGTEVPERDFSSG